MQPILVRPAVGVDAERVAYIYIDSWNQGFGPLMPVRVVTSELIARWERDLTAPLPHQWWVAEVDRALVGFVGIGPSRDPIDPNLGELDTIAVDPAWWRSSVGRTLMAVALRGLADHGWCEAILWTLAHYERGQRFYTATGWQLDGSVRDEGRQLRYRYRFESG
jgi:N-acetylglutamate synthase-like GNAT family acetyltransferase